MCAIICFKADAHQLDKLDQAPIHLAAFNDHYEVVALLSAHSCKNTIQNTAGKSPIVSCLEENKANYDSLEVLLEDGWDPNHTLQANQLKYNDQRRSALFFAVRSDDEDCADLLLQYGAKVDLDPVPGKGMKG